MEGRQQAAAEIGGELQQLRIVGGLILAEQAAKAADGDLEILDVDVLVEGEVLVDVLLRFSGLLIRPMSSMVSRPSIWLMCNETPYQSCGFFESGISAS